VVERFELNHGKAAPFDVHQRLGKDGCPDGKDHATINVPYREAIGALLYISQRARPDIAFAVNSLPRFCESPKKAHWRAVKRVIKYLHTTMDAGIAYHSGGGPLVAYTDADWANDVDTRHSTSESFHY